MFGLGNIFGGLGNLFTMPDMLQALDFLGGEVDPYSQINSMLNPQKMPDFPRLDRQGNTAQPAPSPSSPETLSSLYSLYALLGQGQAQGLSEADLYGGMY